MKLFTGFTAALIGLGTLSIAFGGTASADCFQYNSNGFNTSSTPVFNNICGVPQLGNESDFFRIRQSSNGNDEDNSNNPAYTTGTLNATCNNGDKFDLWNYVHNDAMSAQNPDVGTGSAVAKGVTADLTAPLGTTNDTFKFGDTISATNAASVTENATLNCGGKQKQLSLVSGSVHIYSIPYGNNWLNLPDSTLNTVTPLGSTNTGGEGSGTMWGGWTYRIVIVYQVQVAAVPPTLVAPTCNLLTLESSGQVATIKGLDYTKGSATVNGAYFVFSNNGQVAYTSPVLTVTQLSTLNTAPYKYTFANTGSYTVQAKVKTSVGEVTNTNPGTCIGIFTASTPPSASRTNLASTGPGNVVGVFVATSAIGAGAYRWFLGRRLQRD